MNKSTLWAVIAILLVIILCMTTCNGSNTIPTNNDTLTDTSYIHDTLKIPGKTRIKPVAVPYYVHDTIIDSTGKKTPVQIKKFITNDTFTYITDSVKLTFYTKIYSGNPLDSINNNVKAIIRSKIIEKIVTKETVRKKAFFAGPSVGLSKISYISLDGLYEKEGKIIYKLGVGVNTNLQPLLKAGIYWKISK